MEQLEEERWDTKTEMTTTDQAAISLLSQMNQSCCQRRPSALAASRLEFGSLRQCTSKSRFAQNSDVLNVLAGR